MGRYENILTELIYQSDINLKLLEDVNQRMYDDDNNTEKVEDRLTEIKISHNNNVNEYIAHGYNPPYNYFDGTELINSLFSKIVVPFEWLKELSKKRNKNFMELNIDQYFKKGYKPQENRDHNQQFYDDCRRGIIDLFKNYMAYDNKYNDKNLVYSFFKHIRNSLCHSGSGKIKFYPEASNGVDVTSILFYDKGEKYGSEFLAKIPVEILKNLVFLFDELIIQLSNEIQHHNDFSREQTAGNDIDYFVDFDSIINRIRENTDEDYFPD